MCLVSQTLKVVSGRGEIGEEGLNIQEPSSTDDVECFISMMRDSTGRNFTTKEMKYMAFVK